MVARYTSAQAAIKKPPKSVAVPKKERRKVGGNYFPDEVAPKHFIPSGSVLLDCVLGGGWVLGRVENIVGDKSTGKTLLAIEACANFARVYPKGRIYYREAESAFDISYAHSVGLPTDRVDFGVNGPDTSWRTIEEVFVDLRKIVKYHEEHKVPGLYILDSLDALTSEQALKREVGEGSYNLEKQKILGQLFEQMISDFKEAQLCIIIISQVRDKIGFVVGEKHRRSGGKSLDFYASHIVWLIHIKTLVATVKGEKRATGIRIKAKCKKNKVSVAMRECEFPIRFGFGIDDVEASVDWLVEKKMQDRLGIEKKKGKDGVAEFYDEIADLPPPEYAKRVEQIRTVVVQAWKEVDGWFAPKRKKYE